jgi:hypothetical protein
MEKRLEDDSRIHPIPITGCWIWAGNSTSRGYGQIIIDNKKYYAHRVMYEQTFNVKLDKKDVICHTCDNPSCVNPQHLFRGTQADNLRDMVEKGRSTRGEKNPRAILDEFTVNLIKLNIKAGRSDKEILSIFRSGKTPLSRQNLSLIKSGKRWGHV